MTDGLKITLLKNGPAVIENAKSCSFGGKKIEIGDKCALCRLFHFKILW